MSDIFLQLRGRFFGDDRARCVKTIHIYRAIHPNAAIDDRCWTSTEDRESYVCFIVDR